MVFRYVRKIAAQSAQQLMWVPKGTAAEALMLADRQSGIKSTAFRQVMTTGSVLEAIALWARGL